jgi:hypothetical protein
MNATSGIISVALPLMITDTLKRKFGIKTSCILLSIWVIFPNTLISYTGQIGGFFEYPLLVICNGLCIALFTIYLSIISIAVTNSVETNAPGTAIGFFQAVVSFSRVTATSGTAFLFSSLQNSDFDLPTREHFIFHLSNFYLILIVFLIICFLSKRIEKRVKMQEVISIEESLLER